MKCAALGSLLLVVACGRLDFATRADAGDASDAAACALGPWSAPSSVTELAGAADEAGAQLTADGLALYYASNNDLLRASRPGRDAPFGAPIALSALNTQDVEDDPSPTGDELELYFSRNTSNQWCIEVSHRTATADAWSTPARLGTLCVTHQAACPYITPDGLELYYTLLSTTGTTLMVTSRPNRAASFGPGSPVAGLDALDAGCPALSGDGLTIYFETSTATRDLWQASRPDLASPFGAPQMLPFDTDTYIEEDASVTADGELLVFDSDHTAGGLRQLFEATRSCE